MSDSTSEQSKLVKFLNIIINVIYSFIESYIIEIFNNNPNYILTLITFFYTVYRIEHFYYII